MGGDQVYPVASTTSTENRTLGPYRAALPYRPPATAPGSLRRPRQPRLVRRAHGFMRIFCPGGLDRRLAGPTRRRSYFAVQPASQLVALGDRHPVRQLHRPAPVRYFEKLAKARLKPGDRRPVLMAVPRSRANQSKKPEASRGVRQPRLLRARSSAANGADVRALPRRRPAPLRPLRGPSRRCPASRSPPAAAGPSSQPTHDLPETQVASRRREGPASRRTSCSSSGDCVPVGTRPPEAQRRAWRCRCGTRASGRLLGDLQLLLACMFRRRASSARPHPGRIGRSTPPPS